MLNAQLCKGNCFLCLPFWGQFRASCDQEKRRFGTSRSHLSREGEGLVYLSLIFFLLLLQGQFYEHLLQLLITVVDHKLLKAIILRIKEKDQLTQGPSFFTALPPLSHAPGEPAPSNLGEAG